MKCIVCGKEHPIHCFPLDRSKYNKATKTYGVQDTCKTCNYKASRKNWSRKAAGLYKSVKFASASSTSITAEDKGITGWNGDNEIYC